MRVVGIDFGEARIGVALSDTMGMFSHPYKVVRALPGLAETAALLAAELKQCGPLKQIVLGLPLLLSGKDSPMTTKVRQFAELLKTHFPDIPLLLWDERLTSAGVDRSMKESGVNRKRRSELIDTLSAAAILQTFLDWQRHSKVEP